ncbi:MAG: polyribonucleotide nucleotidyltransferase, partial [Candidatus Bipolaricaulota bacterium]|nr:polyribonucleotide nucleotidyltransferase [Candidatus Bipolaricaulota bacterium]
GDTKVLVTVVCQPTAQELDYFPLRVDFEERFYAGGKIPGGFFKREGRPSDDAVIAARLIDRPIRPLFPDGYREEVHIVATVLSAERDAPPDVVGLIGASAALLISPAPFAGPVGAVRLGMDGDTIVPHPHDDLRETGAMDIVVAGTRSTVTMVEGHLREVPDERVVEAIEFAHGHIRELIAFQEEFAALHTV